MDPFELPEAPDLSGQVERLGTKPAFSGPYSCIYHGKLKKTDQMVAIKVINSIKGSTLQTMQRKLKRERRTWGALDHPNILPLLGFADDLDVSESFSALISPWLQRGDAHEFLTINGDSITLNDRVSLWKDVISGVDYLHSYNPVLIHGDLKSKNILIDDSGHAQICDFGLVRIFLEAGHSGMTTTTEHTGTERYLAYELVAENDTPTTASDIHAVGCIGLEFVFSKIPYATCANNATGKIFFHIRDGKPPAERSVNPSRALEYIWSLLEISWNLDPTRRPSAGELLASLNESSEVFGGVAPIPESSMEPEPSNTSDPLEQNEEISVPSLSGAQGPNDSAGNSSRLHLRPLDYENPLAIFNQKCTAKRWASNWSFARTGPPHSPEFRATVRLPGLSPEPLGTGVGNTKQMAKREAASLALAHQVFGSSYGLLPDES